MVTPFRQLSRTQLYFINLSGEKKLVREFTKFDKQKSTFERMFYKIHNTYNFAIPTVNGDIFLYDTAFQEHDVISLDQPISSIEPMDVDLDSQDEVLGFDVVSRKFSIFREDFSHQATISLELSGPNRTTISLKKDNQATPSISITTGTYITFYPIMSILYGTPAGDMDSALAGGIPFYPHDPENPTGPARKTLCK